MQASWGSRAYLTPSQSGSLFFLNPSNDTSEAEQGFGVVFFTQVLVLGGHTSTHRSTGPSAGVSCFSSAFSDQEAPSREVKGPAQGHPEESQFMPRGSGFGVRREEVRS